MRRRLEPEARREEILAAAERVLRRDGNARVEDVMREARAAKGTFYLYFASWADLLLALRERVFVRFDALHPPTTDWYGLVDSMAVGFVDFTLTLGGLHRAIFHGPAALQTGSGGAVGRIAVLIEAGMKAGAFAALDAKPTARLIFAVLHEAVDAIEAGEDRDCVLRAMNTLLDRCLFARAAR